MNVVQFVIGTCFFAAGVVVIVFHRRQDVRSQVLALLTRGRGDLDAGVPTWGALLFGIVITSFGLIAAVESFRF